MSTSPLQLRQFAEFVKDHEALPIFKERVQERFFKLFVNAMPEDRAKIGGAVDCAAFFFDEMNKVINEMQKDEPVNDTAEDTEL